MKLSMPDQLPQIEFTRNDNCKLFLEYFSCIRPNDAALFAHGNQVEVMLKGESLGIAEVVAVKVFRFIDLNDIVSYLDNGRPVQYMAAAIKKQYGAENNTELAHVVLHYIQRNLETQGKLLMDWWTDVYSLHVNTEPNKPALHG